MFDIEKCIANWKVLNANGHHVFSPKKAKGKEQAFNLSEAKSIIKFALKTRDYMSLAVAILITTGLRLGEILGLKIDDVHLDDGYVFVVRKENTKSYILEDYTKSNKQRCVDLSPLAIRLFIALIELRERDNCDIPFLLLNYDKYGCLIKMHTRAIDNYLREIIHKTVLRLDKSFEARSSHDCRRTYASLEFFNGTDIYVIQQQMGHSDVNQTWDYIRDVTDLEQRKTRLRGIGVDIDDVDDDVVDTGKIVVYADYTQAKK